MTLSELLLDADLDLYDTRAVERLMSYLLVREPARFAPYLARALAGPPPVAERAGRLWALLEIRDTLPDGLPRALSDLLLEAPRGAAEAFARNADDSIEQLTALFNDPDKEVREKAAGCLRFLERHSEATAAAIIAAFTGSKAFEEHFDEFIRPLE
jgi:hypothetical protein